MSEELKVKRSYAIPENEMVIIKDTNTLLHNIVDSELKEKDKEIERLTKQNKALNEMYELTKKEYIRLHSIIKETSEDLHQVVKWCTENKHNEDTIERYLVVDYGTIVGKINEIRTKLDKGE